MDASEVRAGGVEDMVFSCDARLQGIESVFDSTRQIISGFQKSSADLKRERDNLYSDLREELARNESLRKRDFDHMARGFLSAQEGGEREVWSLVDGYFSRQRETSEELREGLKKFRDCLSSGEAKRIREYRAMIGKILAEQEERRKEVVARLKEFRREQRETAKRLKSLAAKGRELRIRDLKQLLAKYNPSHQSGADRREARKAAVRDLLDDFKNNRLEGERARRAGRAPEGSGGGATVRSANPKEGG